MAPPGDELAQRVGDRDRERVAEELRLHHLEGRLDAEELEERVGAAYAARTRGELAVLVADLPLPARPTVTSSPAPPPKTGGFGVLGFTQVHDLDASPEDAYVEALDLIHGAMAGYGYQLVERDRGRSLTFELRERPLWVPVVCIVLFPFGLLALHSWRTTRVRVAFLPRPDDRCQVRVSGEARRPVRKAFTQLSGG